MSDTESSGSSTEVTQNNGNYSFTSDTRMNGDEIAVERRTYHRESSRDGEKKTSKSTEVVEKVIYKAGRKK